LGFTRQAFYKSLRSRVDKSFTLLQFDALAAKERSGCPGKGCRSMYCDNKDSFPEGRDKSEQQMYQLGYRLPSKQKYVRTTEAGRRTFDNLLVNKDVTDVNQVWQCDMTYYQRSGKTFYSMFITDVYSQRIVGHGAFENAYAVNFLITLNRAIQLRKKRGYNLEGLIHHSDGGKQYESKIYQ
jgi:putative transposase